MVFAIRFTYMFKDYFLEKVLKTPKGNINFKMIQAPVDMVGDKKLENYHVKLYENARSFSDVSLDSADIYVIFSYDRKFKGGQIKRASCIGVLSGRLDAMYHHITTCDYEKKDQLLNAWKKAKYKNTIAAGKNSKTNPFNRVETSNKLLAELVERNLDAAKFAEMTGKDYANVHREIVSGKRKISIEQVMQYSKALGVDPADLLFEKKHCHIWAKVDFLKTSRLEEDFSPGTLYPYYTDMNEAEVVEVPRTFWRPDILAVKIISKASMYSGQVAFYYKSEWNPKGINNNNRLVVTCNEVNFEDFDIKKNYFYLGIYEEYEGKINIKNPDPYAKEKYIVKDIDPIFVAPVVALVRPNLIERDVIAKEKIRDHHKVLENTLAQDKTFMAMKKIQEEFNKHGKVTNQLQKDIDAIKKATEALTHATTGLLYEEDKTKDLSKFLLDKFYEDRKKAS